MKRLFQFIQALILVGLVCTLVNAANYRFTILDVTGVPGVTDTQLVGINDAGQISGTCGVTSHNFLNVWVTAHGVLYSHGQFTPPFDVPGAPGSTHGAGINALGRIVGYYSDANGTHGFQYDPTNVNPFVNPLDADLNVDTIAYGINSQPTIAGYFNTSGGQSIGFSYAGGTWQTFSFPGFTVTRAVGINDAGEILGYYGNYPVEHGFIKANEANGGGYTFIDNNQAFGTILYGKNGANQIVGACKDSNGNYHGFLYENDTFTPIEPPGAIQSWAKGINKRGQIVGHYIDHDYINHGFLATPATSAALQLLLLD